MVGCVEEHQRDDDSQDAVHPPEFVGEEDANQHDDRRQCVRAMMPAVSFDAYIFGFASQPKGELCQEFLGDDRDDGDHDGESAEFCCLMSLEASDGVADEFKGDKSQQKGDE